MRREIESKVVDKLQSIALLTGLCRNEQILEEIEKDLSGIYRALRAQVHEEQSGQEKHVPN